MLRIIAVRSFSPLKVHDWIFRLTSDYHKEEEALKILKGYTNSVIEKKKHTSSNGVAAKESNKKKHLAFLDLLFERKDEISEELLSNMVEGLMFAVSNFC